ISRTGTVCGAYPLSATVTLNGPVTGTVSRQGVTQLAPPALAWAPGGSDSTASEATPDAPPPPKLGMSKLGIHEDVHAVSAKPHATPAMTRYMILTPITRSARMLLPHGTIRVAPAHRNCARPARASGSCTPFFGAPYPPESTPIAATVCQNAA